MTQRTWFGRLTAAAVVALAAGSTATAGLLPVNVTITPEDGKYRWTYAIVLPTDMKLQSGNYFTIYDFNGYIPGGETAPDGWTVSSSNVGPTPDRLRPNDDAAIPNLTFKYNGPTIPSGQIGLGNFWAYSQYGNQKEEFFTARTNRTSDGLVDSNITDTIVPTGSGGGGTLVPEPATLVLTGLGLPLAGLARFARSRKVLG
ncbi:MAG: PEP-CTERM sorting domain-containing protein [Gemmataceae bacterium]